MIHALVLAALLAVVTVSSAQYKNPYKIEPIKPLGSSTLTNMYGSSSTDLYKSTTGSSLTNLYGSSSFTTTKSPYRATRSSLSNLYGGNKSLPGASNLDALNPRKVVSPTGKYLGRTDPNPYDPDSINNPYGRYGSKYSADSVNNPYGLFGSKFSPESANNPYATSTPKLHDGTSGAYRGKLSANKYDSDSIENTYSGFSDPPLAAQRQAVRGKIFKAYSSDPDRFLEKFGKLDSEDREAILKILSD